MLDTIRVIHTSGANQDCLVAVAAIEKFALRLPWPRERRMSQTEFCSAFGLPPAMPRREFAALMEQIGSVTVSVRVVDSTTIPSTVRLIGSFGFFELFFVTENHVTFRVTPSLWADWRERV